ncbi:MAG: orotidine-5'-phosphate decarboxylase [Polyangiales bacterium]
MDVTLPAPKPRACALAFALDVPDLAQAERWIARLAPQVDVFKVGLELFTAVGPAAVQAVQAAGKPCFVDLKLHDIPATVARTVRQLGSLGAHFVTLHASGGAPMLKAAQAAAAELPHLCLLAVTALTSLDQAALQGIGVAESPADWAERLAQLATESGIGGLVCSAHECAALRALGGPALQLVVPGIRLAGSAADDQRRSASAHMAAAAGASMLVVGRPIRDSAHPEAVIQALRAEMAQAAAA